MDIKFVPHTDCKSMPVNGVLMGGALEFVRKVKEAIPNARIYIASNGAAINAKGRIASTIEKR